MLKDIYRDDSLDHDIGNTPETYYRQIQSDIGDEAADTFKKQVEYLRSLEDTVDPETNIAIIMDDLHAKIEKLLNKLG